jgi:hypothetical protein
MDTFIGFGWKLSHRRPPRREILCAICFSLILEPTSELSSEVCIRCRPLGALYELFVAPISPDYCKF